MLVLEEDERLGHDGGEFEKVLYISSGEWSRRERTGQLDAASLGSISLPIYSIAPISVFVFRQVFFMLYRLYLS
jgi:hypothetical protein